MDRDDINWGKYTVDSVENIWPKIKLGYATRKANRHLATKVGYCGITNLNFFSVMFLVR